MARYLALFLATLAFIMNFWAWSLLGPLASRYRDLLQLSAFSLSLLLAVPVLVGSLGRVVVGALSDRYGGRLVFAAISFFTILPVMFLSQAGSYGTLVAGAFVLGLAGASFAVGVPFVNAWFPPERRGLALGLYGMGNMGTALANFVAPRMWDSGGRTLPYLAAAGGLAVIGVLMLLVGRNAPDFVPSKVPMRERFAAVLKLRLTYELAALYGITFGGLVAFGVYLPTYLWSAYHLTPNDAAARAAGFVLLATLTRPAGGWLADRFGGDLVLKASLAAVGLGAIVASFTPSMVSLTVDMLTMAAALGVANGAIFALVGRHSPPGQAGAITGIVGAVGGLGGFLPPLVMGMTFQATQSFSIGFMLLSDVAFAGLVFAAFGMATGRIGDHEPVPA